MAAASISAAAAPTASAQPIVKMDIEARVKELIAIADKKFKLSDADVDKTFADIKYTELKGRAKIYICKTAVGAKVALIPVLYLKEMAYLVMAFTPLQQSTTNFITHDGKEYVVRDVDPIWNGESTTVQIQLEEKS